MFAEILAFLGTTPGKALATGVALTIVSVGTGAYVVGKDVGEKQLQVYQAANSIDFKLVAKEATDATVGMRIAAKELIDVFDARKRVSELQKQLDQKDLDHKQLSSAAEAEIKNLKESGANLLSKLTSVSEELALTKRELSNFTSPETRVQIPEHTSKSVAQGRVRIGVVYSGSSFAVLMINGKEHQVKVGSIVPAENTGNASCSVIIDRTTTREVFVDVQCK
jgi:hypothetical protein